MEMMPYHERCYKVRDICCRRCCHHALYCKVTNLLTENIDLIIIQNDKLYFKIIVTLKAAASASNHYRNKSEQISLTYFLFSLPQQKYLVNVH